MTDEQGQHDRPDHPGAGGIDWSMSAALANVERGGNAVPEVTSLERAVRAWLALDNALQNAAVLKPEHAVTVDGERTVAFSGQAIRALADRLP